MTGAAYISRWKRRLRDAGGLVLEGDGMVMASGFVLFG